MHTYRSFRTLTLLAVGLALLAASGCPENRPDPKKGKMPAARTPTSNGTKPTVKPSPNGKGPNGGSGEPKETPTLSPEEIKKRKEEKAEKARAEKILAEFLKKVQTAKRSLGNFKADLVFETHSPSWNATTRSEGKIIFFAARGRAKVSFNDKSDPAIKKGVKTEYVEDGPFLWRYYPGKKEVEQYFQGARGDVRAMMDILASPVERLKQIFTIRLYTRKKQSVLSLHYKKPKKKSKITSIDVTFDDKYRPTEFTIHERNRDRKTWSLDNLVPNATIKPESVLFNPNIKGLKGNPLVTAKPDQIAQAVLELARENGAWPHGWKLGSFTEKSGKKVISKCEFVLSWEGAFRIKTWKPKDTLPMKYFFDGSKLVVHDVSGKVARIRQTDAAGAMAALPLSVRLAISAVQGTLLRRPGDFQAKPEKKDPKKKKKKKSFATYPTEFELRVKKGKAYGVKMMTLSLDKPTFRIAKVSFVRADGKRVVIDDLSRAPNLTPMKEKQFAFTPLEDVKIIKEKGDGTG